jgi:hypothetical protein
MPDNRGLRKLLLAAAAVAFAVALIVWLTGGVNLRVGETAIRARGAIRPLIVGFVLLVAYVLLDRRAVAAALGDRPRAIARLATGIALTAALTVTTLALQYGAFVAGGSDAYGYLSQAYGWARGDLPRPYAVPLTLPFAQSDWAQAPLGHRPGTAPHTIVPTYSPGLPLLMAIGIGLADPIGPYLIVPLSAGAFVLATFLLARRMAGPAAGAAAAVIAATCPVALFLVLWPMSDVPAAALWTGTAAAALGNRRRDTIAAGACAALGILVRPNLVPLAVLPLAFRLKAETTGRGGWREAALYCAIWMPAAIAIAALNTAWYGSPLLSGYGSNASLYSVQNIPINLPRFLTWIYETESAGILAAAVTLGALVRRSPMRAPVLLAWALFILTFLLYVTYIPFNAWWFLRFLLPGLGGLFALAAVGLVTLARRVRRPWGHAIACAGLAWIAWHAAGYARALEMWGPYKASEHKYPDVGAFIARRMPPDAVFFAVQHSGTIRYYGGRHSLRYDMLDSNTAPRAMTALEQRGFHPYLAIEDGETQYVRKAFGFAADAPLPWPRVARMRQFGGFTIFDLAAHPAVEDPVPIEPGLAAPYSPPVPVRIEPATRNR